MRSRWPTRVVGSRDELCAKGADQIHVRDVSDDQGCARSLTMCPENRVWRVMIGRLIPPLLILPGTVLVLVPALIIWLTHGTGREVQLVGFDDLRFWLALLLTCAGLAPAIRTCQLFATVGKGTPAPWDPPQKLVVQGPYRYLRNPMITSVLLLRAAEVLFLGSRALAGWLLVVFLANAVYFPLVEEKALERRFGDQYRLYKANVPRWIPRIRPWRQP